jgi:hypothetical protein
VQSQAQEINDSYWQPLEQVTGEECKRFRKLFLFSRRPWRSWGKHTDLLRGTYCVGVNLLAFPHLVLYLFHQENLVLGSLPGSGCPWLSEKAL